MKLLALTFVTTLFILGGPSRAEVRTFTSSAGTTLKGELVSVVGDTVTIKKEDGTPLTLKLAAFSRVDQAWLQTQTTAAPAGASDPAKATKDAPFVNSLGMKFVPVPGTNVLFCTTLAPAQVYHQFNFEVNKVQLPGPNAENFDFEKKRAPSLFPISEINYDKAKAFCDWLSQKEGHAYRMPTDREWSIAIGIGSQESPSSTPEELDRKIKNLFPWGSSWPPPAGFANYCDETYLDFCKRNKYTAGDTIKGYTDGEIACSPMTAYPPNKIGLHDMSGNLLQWCEGWYDKGQTRRFLRGSMWGQSSKADLLASARYPLDPGMNTKKDLASAIRVVLELPKP
ncbi:MAG: SUMF1/EgtB/PvdO family nonheme iron enzyme [Verrucomicrobiaceae bacterium]|nr:SUMF1/EgtB/PvdO family nonheme iron enzyme [Verrucomicrobiaceae bacterium]